MANKLKLTRDQLASFLKDAEQIKQFEQLFALADSIAPDVVNEININAGNAQASANDALAQLQRLADAFELVETPPPIKHNNSVQTDYVDINPLAPTPVEKVGRLYWTDDYATLEFGLEGGVTGQICQQLDFHPKNTGATQINKGMAVMATGVIGSSTKITCARAVADGSVAAQYMLGIAAQNIPVNSFGYIVWFGSVRGFNTTGANKTVPEVWVDGDILYFDPNYPGELTKIQPSAPDLDLPIAIVTNAANNGSIFVRMKTGESMNELHDVNTATATNGDLLQYYGAGPYWRNVAPSTVSVGTATNLAGGAAGSVPYQSGASTTTFLSIGTADQVLAVNAGGTAPEWDSTTGTGNVVRATSPTLVTPLLGTPTSGTLTNCTGLPIVGGTTGTLSAARGGTGQTTYAVGDLLYADTASSLAKLADVATGNALISGGVGVAPAWGKIGLTTHVSGTLPVANGGTGITSLGAGVATWLGTPSSANLLAAMTDETGTGSLVFGTSPTLITPTLGVASGTSLSLSNNLTFSSTGQRITGDFSTATIANRPLFQTTVANSATTIGVIPSGTAINATISLESAESATNCSAAQLGVVGGTDVRITSLARGTGTVLPIAFWIGGSERMRIDNAGNVFVNTTGYTVITAAGTVSPRIGAVGPIISVRGAAGGGEARYHLYNVGSTAEWLMGQKSGTAHNFVLSKMASGVELDHLVVTPAGNVGIGTSTPDAQLTVNTIASFGDGATATPSIAHKGDLNTGFWFPAADTIAASTAGIERVRIAPSGHMGVNTIPSPWVASVRAIQLGSGASMACWDGGNGNVTLGANLYDSGGAVIRYINSAAAGAFNIISGAFTWDTAAAGVAGDAITFTRSMTLTAAGNLGIGTTAPAADAPLHIRSVAGGIKRVLLQNIATTAGTQSRYDLATGTANAFSIMSLTENGTGNVTFELSNGSGVNTGMFFSSGTTSAPIVFRQSTTERMRIDSSGYVLAGTSSAITGLVSRFTNAGTDADTFYAAVRYVNSQAAPGVRFGKSRGATVGTHAALVSGDRFGEVQMFGSDGTNFVEGGKIWGEVDGAVSLGVMPGRLTFYTTPAGTGTATEKMRITSAGEVLIGATAAINSSKLLVAGVTGSNPAVIQGSAAASAALAFYNNAATTNRFMIGQGYVTASDNIAFIQNYVSAALVFGTNSTERMRVDASGNVGIGTATNLSTLTVNGSFASKSPSTVNAATYSVAATDGSLRFTTTNCTVTLPAAASFPGRILYLNTITANSVVSASSNVIPLGSNTAGTAILAATLGKFAMIQSDGTNWITMMAN